VTAEDLLTTQHAEMKALFRRARAPGSFTARLRARDELLSFLRAHSSLEEEQIDAKLEDLEDITEWVDASFRAHELMKEVGDELEATSPADAEYLAVMDELEELVDEHVELEETRLLTRLVDRLARDRREALGAEMAARFEELRSSGARPVVEIDRDQLPDA
jgi:hypothetical protein